MERTSQSIKNDIDSFLSSGGSISEIPRGVIADREGKVKPFTILKNGRTDIKRTSKRKKKDYSPNLRISEFAKKFGLSLGQVKNHVTKKKLKTSDYEIGKPRLITPEDGEAYLNYLRKTGQL